MWIEKQPLQFEYFRSISGEEAAEDSEEAELDSDSEEQEAPSDYVKGEHWVLSSELWAHHLVISDLVTWLDQQI